MMKPTLWGEYLHVGWSNDWNEDGWNFFENNYNGTVVYEVI